MLKCLKTYHSVLMYSMAFQDFKNRALQVLEKNVHLIRCGAGFVGSHVKLILHLAALVRVKFDPCCVASCCSDCLALHKNNQNTLLGNALNYEERHLLALFTHNIRPECLSC